MSDQKDRHIGQWHNPLSINEEREKIREELTESEIEEFNELWEASGKFRPPTGRSAEQRLNFLEGQIDAEVVMVPMYRSKAFKSAVGAFVVASVLFGLLYFLKPIDHNQLFVTGMAEDLSIELPDGSMVKLNADSELKYSKEEWGNQRHVSLMGEAYFEVVKSDKSFIVSTGTTDVTVLGTSFNVKYRKDDQLTACLSGKVRVQNNNGEGVELTKGLATRVSNGQILQPFQVEEASIGSWKDGKFFFNETPLLEVFEEIQRQFGVTISSDLDFSSKNFNGYFLNDDLHKSLSIVCLSAGLQFKIEENAVNVFY